VQVREAIVEHHNPLEQFAIQRIVPLHIGGVDVSITNSTVFMVLAIALITLFLTMSMRGGSLVPSRWQSMAELSYEFVGNMIRENVGNEGRPYFPFIFSLFIFIPGIGWWIAGAILAFSKRPTVDASSSGGTTNV